MRLPWNTPRHVWRHLSREELQGALLTAATMALAVVASAALLVGCASTGGIAPKQALMTPQALGATPAASGAGATWPATQWWKNFGDTRLDALVDQALAGQPALQTVQARLQQAQAAVDAAGAARRPQINGSADATYQRYTENGLIPPPLAGTTKWSANAQLSASWELDLFGRQRAALASSIGQLHAAEAEAQAARVLLAGNVVTAYVNLARIGALRELTQQGLQQREQVLAIVRQRISAGLDTTVDLRQAEGFVAQTQVELEALDESAGRARHALAELVGLGPDGLADLSPKLASVHAAPLPAAVPAELIGRRADIVAQRWRVEAAAKDVDVARTQFYPNVNLIGFIGLSSLGLDKLVKSGSETWGAGPALRLPIFDGGRLRANLSARSADVDLAVDTYNATLLRALREVADELGSLRSLERQQAAQAEALKSSEAAFELALQRYRAGLGNFLVVLTADANVIAQRRATTDLQARHLTAEVALARALGGGYAGAPVAGSPTTVAAH